MPTILLSTKSGVVIGEAIVDACDHADLDRYTWKLHSTGYVTRRLRGGTTAYGMHRHVLGLKQGDGQMVDHINGDRLDNRRSNLRLANCALNAQNQAGRSDASSRFRGVYFDQANGKWVARVTVNGHVHRLGVFNNELLAGVAAERCRRERMPLSRHDRALVVAANAAGVAI